MKEKSTRHTGTVALQTVDVPKKSENYTPDQVANKLLPWAKSTLARKRMTGDGPKWKRCGRKILYPSESLHAFVESLPGGGGGKHA